VGWTLAKSWTVGERPTAAKFNEQVRDNLNALLAIGGGSLLNPMKIFAGQSGAAPFPVGNGTDMQIGTTGGNFAGAANAIDFDNLNTISQTYWRLRVVFNLATIVPGAPSAVSWTARIRRLAIAGSATAEGTTLDLGSASIVNTAGYKAYDTGWAGITGSGLQLWVPVWRTDRIGGSGTGLTGAGVLWWFEVLNSL
jgi:hypothetical protein